MIGNNHMSNMDWVESTEIELPIAEITVAPPEVHALPDKPPIGHRNE